MVKNLKLMTFCGGYQRLVTAGATVGVRKVPGGNLCYLQEFPEIHTSFFRFLKCV